MHILLITSEELYPDNLLGSIFEISQAKALQKKGIQVSILSVRIFPNIEQWLKLVIKAFLADLNFSTPKGKYYSFWRTLFSVPKYLSKTEIKGYKIDGIQVIEGISYPSSSIKKNWDTYTKFWCKTGMQTVDRYIESNGCPDIIHAHSRFLLAGLLAHEIKENYKIPFVITEHSSFYKRQFSRNANLKRQMRKYIETMFLSSNANFFVSSDLKKLVEEQFPKVLRTPSYVIPNILNEEFNNEYSEITLYPGSLIKICSIGSLDKNKNHIFLIKAVEEITKYSPLKINVKIIGEGILREELEREILNRKLDNIELLGNLPTEEVMRIIDTSHFLVHPSIYESFGVVIIESLARGRPVISTCSGGPEGIINDENGILIQNDQKSLEEAILKMAREYNNYNLQSIRAKTLEAFGSSPVGDQLIALYTKYI